MENKSCQICKRTRFEDFVFITTYKIGFCKKCKIGITLAKRREEKVKELYSENYISNYSDREKEMTEQFGKVLSKIKSYLPQKARVLDVGCGIGLFLKLLSKDSSGYPLYGLEPSKALYKEAKKQISKAKFQNKTIENSSFKESYFDCITFWDVLEHVPDLNKVLAKTRKLLKKNGMLVVQAPNYQSVMAKITGKNWDWWLIPDHQYHFSPRSIQLILEKNGFVIQHLETRESREIFIKNIKAQILGDSITIRIIRKIFGEILTFFYPFIEILTRSTKTGGLVFVIARKK